MLRFVKDIGGSGQLAGRSTAEVVERFVKPATQRRRSTYCEELLDSGCAVACSAVMDFSDPRSAGIFVSHSWSLQCVRWMRCAASFARHCLTPHMLSPFPGTILP